MAGIIMRICIILHSKSGQYRLFHIARFMVIYVRNKFCLHIVIAAYILISDCFSDD